MENTDSSKRVNENPSLPLPNMKRRAGKDIEPLKKYHNLLKQPPSPTPSNVSSNSSVEGDKNTLGLEFGGIEYTADELKHILECKKLKKVACDPKRVRRILANRESARRSYQRKSQKIIDLDQKIKFLESQNNSMSEKITLSERENKMMMDEREEIKIRLDSLEKQSQLGDDESGRLKVTTTLNEEVSVDAKRLKEVLASNEQLSLELQRLKMGTDEVNQDHRQVDGSNMHQIDPNMIQRLTINELNQPQTNPDFSG